MCCFRSAHSTTRVTSFVPPAHAPLKHGTNALILDDLHSAIERAVVKPLLLRLFSLHLQATADGVKRIGDEASDDGGRLRNGELGSEPNNAFVLLPRVQLLESVENTKIRTTVRDDAHN